MRQHPYYLPNLSSKELQTINMFMTQYLAVTSGEGLLETTLLSLTTHGAELKHRIHKDNLLLYPSLIHPQNTINLVH